MKLKLLILLAVAFLPAFSFAQSALTIFSESGDKFYLVLDGEKQNTVPQTNIRIDGLSQPYYSARIIFEDQTKPEISKNLPVVDPSTNTPADVTYKIKKQKDGDMKLRYFSAIPVDPNYAAPANVYVMHVGQQAPGSATITETTVTTTAPNTSNGGVSINVVDPNTGAGGVNMSINVANPAMNTTATQTTTTRTTTTYTSSSGNYDNHPRSGCMYPMDGNSFKSAKESVSKASFEETKLSTAKTILGANCFCADQVKQVCQLFSFEASKLEFAKFAYSKCTDKGNYFKIGDIFSFDASREELNNYISGH
jgi:hypothetical protein